MPLQLFGLIPEIELQDAEFFKKGRYKDVAGGQLEAWYATFEARD